MSLPNSNLRKPKTKETENIEEILTPSSEGIEFLQEIKIPEHQEELVEEKPSKKKRKSKKSLLS